MNRVQVIFTMASFMSACVASGAPASTTYLCVGEQATGFSIDQRSHTWKKRTYLGPANTLSNCQ